ncbi:MAG: PH domain-containing protein, partial [Leptospirillia bacterium]
VVVLSVIDVSAITTLAFSLSCWTSSDQLFIHYGMLRPVYATLDAADIRSVGADQKPLGRLLGYGSLIILGRNAGIHMEFVKNPDAAAESIRNWIRSAKLAQDSGQTE